MSARETNDTLTKDSTDSGVRTETQILGWLGRFMIYIVLVATLFITMVPML